MKKIDMIGKKFGRLTVLSSSFKRGKELTWACRCDCGKEKVIRGQTLRGGVSRSCGCLCKEKNRKIQTKHGKHKTKIYGVWAGMKQRCLNPKREKYKIYGARGIKICKEWLCFENFYKDMGDPPPGHSIERIDNNGNYELSNCRWATRQDQANNTRTNKLIGFYGSKFTLSQWARILNISARTLNARLSDYGWSVRKALTTPLGARYKNWQT